LQSGQQPTARHFNHQPTKAETMPNLTKANTSRRDSYLAKLIRVRGVVMSRREWIELLVAEGHKLDTYQKPDATARKKAAFALMSMKRRGIDPIRGLSNDKHPDFQRFWKLEDEAFGAMVTMYAARKDGDSTFWKLTKTEAEYLSEIVTQTV
jgi:hypothetical protein